MVTQENDSDFGSGFTHGNHTGSCLSPETDTFQFKAKMCGLKYCYVLTMEVNYVIQETVFSFVLYG
jgi:hypothetical protein